MAWGLVDGKGLVSLVLTRPLSGSWVAQFSVEPDDESTDPRLVGSKRLVLATDDGSQLELNGVFDGTLTYGVVVGWAHGGRGDMSKRVRPQHYRNATLRRVVEDLARAAGEALASNVDTGLLSTQLDAYTVLGSGAGVALSTLLGAVAPDASWRFLDDGTLWVGRETWPAYTGGWQLVMDRPIEKAIDIEVDDDAPLPTPGQSLDGRNIVGVVARLDANGLSLRIYF